MQNPVRPEIAEAVGEVVEPDALEIERKAEFIDELNTTYEQNGDQKPCYNHMLNLRDQKTDPGCCGCPAVPKEDSYDFLVGSKALRLLKLCGAASVLFSIVELGLGGAVFNTLLNRKLGAFWAGILALYGGVAALYCETKTIAIITCVLSCASIVVTVAGGVLDGLGASVFSTLVACTSSDDRTTKQYGDAAYFLYSDNCARNAKDDFTFVSGGCYCVPTNGDCYEYTLSPFAKSTAMSCGSIITRYTPTLIASVTLCGMLITCGIIISCISFALLCCPDRLSKIARPGDDFPESSATIIVGIHGHENTF